MIVFHLWAAVLTLSIRAVRVLSVSLGRFFILWLVLEVLLILVLPLLSGAHRSKLERRLKYFLIQALAGLRFLISSVISNPGLCCVRLFVKLGL